MQIGAPAKAIVLLAVLVAIVACKGNEEAADSSASKHSAPLPSPASAALPTSLAAPASPDAAPAAEPANQAAAVAPTPPDAQPATSKQASPAGRSSLTARLLGREGGMPHCGVMYVVEVMLYEVVSATAEFAAGEQVAVAQGCPEFLQAKLGLHTGAPAFFVVGALYDLEVARRYPSTAPDREGPWPAVGGHKIADNAKLWWAERVQPHPESL